MKKLAAIVGAAVAIAIVAVIAAPFIVPVELYKDRIADQVSRATGRTFKINGPVRLSILPRLEIEASDVTLANAPGAAVPDMLRLARLQLQLKLRPLLSGELEIDRFVLIEPTLLLEIDDQGRRNWRFLAESPPPSLRLQPTTTPSYQPGEVRFGDVRLVNGHVTFVDRRTGRQEEFTDVNLRVTLPSLNEPATAEGEAVWRGTTAQLALHSRDPRALLDGRASPLTATFASETLRMDFNGRAGTTPVLADGSLSIAVPSLSRLGQWLGEPIDLSGPGAFALSGTIIARAAKASLMADRVALDDASGRGEFAVDFTAAKPFVRAQVELGALDLTPYLPPRVEMRDLAPPVPAASWNAEPLDITALQTANGEFQFAATSLRLRDIRIGRTLVTAQLRDGRLVAEIAETTLYRGRGRGRAVVDASGAVPTLEANVKLAGLHAASLLSDIAGTDHFAGIGALDLTLVGRGHSTRELVANLAGEGEFRIYDGAIKGVDLAEMTREPRAAFSEAKISDARQTDFAELTGTLSINRGIVRNFDLMLKSPLLRVEGTGAIDLPQRRLTYRLLPKSVIRDGVSADGALAPVIVEGPWDDLVYRRDALPPARRIDPEKVPERSGAAPPRTLSTTPQPAPAATPPSRPMELRRAPR